MIVFLMRSFATTFLSMLVLTNVWPTLARATEDSPAPEKNTASRLAPSLSFDAARLREGRFTYRVTAAGKPQGSFVVTIRRQPDGTYRFTGDAIGFNQHWESVTTARFEPIRALLMLTRHGQPYRMELIYGNNGVSATEITGDPAAPAAVVKKTAAPLTTGPTIDQRIDWASVMASDLTPISARAFMFMMRSPPPAVCSSPPASPRSCAARWAHMK
jgi:hypothetical protein